MGWGGHTLDMIRRMQVNRDLILGRRERTKKTLDAQRSFNYRGNHKKAEKKLSSEELKAFSKSIKLQKRAERAGVRKRTLAVIGFLFLLAFLIFGISIEI